MTSIDAWVEDGEIGCCRSVPPPGERWAAILVFDGEVTASDFQRLERLPSGVMRIAGPVEKRIVGPQRMAVVRCGPVHVVMYDPPDGEGLEGEGRLFEDNHFHYIDEDGCTRWSNEDECKRWKTTGTVRRLWVVPGNDGKYRDWPDDTGLLKGEPKEVAAIDPRWCGPNSWAARLEVEIDP